MGRLYQMDEVTFIWRGRVVYEFEGVLALHFHIAERRSHVQ